MIMHEMSVCLALLREVQTVAAEHQAQRVYCIQVQIGPLAGVEPDLLAQAFPLACAGSIADHARLILQPAPVRVRCLRCQAESETTVQALSCAHCGHTHTQLLSGDELLLTGVELDA